MKNKILSILLPVFAFAVSICSLYFMTASFLASFITTLFITLFLLSLLLCDKGMKKMKELESYSVRNGLPKKSMCGKAILASTMVFSPLYFAHLLPIFIPLGSFYVWMVIQFPLLVFDTLYIITLGEAYRDITGIKYPVYVINGSIFLFLSVFNLIIM